MTTLMLVAALAALSASPTSVQTVPAAPAPVAPAGPRGEPATDTPVLAGAEAAPDCGALANMSGRAFCVSALLTGVGTVADAYIADFEGRGWLVAGGDDNRVVFIKRRDGGGCDGLQMQAFYDTQAIVTPTTRGYLAFATIPGDVCAAQPAAGASAQ